MHLNEISVEIKAQTKYVEMFVNFRVQEIVKDGETDQYSDGLLQKLLYNHLYSKWILVIQPHRPTIQMCEFI